MIKLPEQAILEMNKEAKEIYEEDARKLSTIPDGLRKKKQYGLALPYERSIWHKGWGKELGSTTWKVQ